MACYKNSWLELHLSEFNCSAIEDACCDFKKGVCHGDVIFDLLFLCEHITFILFLLRDPLVEVTWVLDCHRAWDMRMLGVGVSVEGRHGESKRAGPNDALPFMWIEGLDSNEVTW